MGLFTSEKTKQERAKATASMKRAEAERAKATASMKRAEVERERAEASKERAKTKQLNEKNALEKARIEQEASIEKAKIDAESKQIELLMKMTPEERENFYQYKKQEEEDLKKVQDKIKLKKSLIAKAKKFYFTIESGENVSRNSDIKVSISELKKNVENLNVNGFFSLVEYDIPFIYMNMFINKKSYDFEIDLDHIIDFKLHSPKLLNIFNIEKATIQKFPFIFNFASAPFSFSIIYDKNIEIEEDVPYPKNNTSNLIAFTKNNGSIKLKIANKSDYDDLPILLEKLNHMTNIY